MAKAFFLYFYGYESGGDFLFGKTVWAAGGTKNTLSRKVGKFHSFLPRAFKFSSSWQLTSGNFL
jgi:hypothetical protein